MLHAKILYFWLLVWKYNWNTINSAFDVCCVPNLAIHDLTDKLHNPLRQWRRFALNLVRQPSSPTSWNTTKWFHVGEWHLRSRIWKEKVILAIEWMIWAMVAHRSCHKAPNVRNKYAMIFSWISPRGASCPGVHTNNRKHRMFMPSRLQCGRNCITIKSTIACDTAPLPCK